MLHNNDTITAVATGTGGAIAIIRVSGPDAIDICSRITRCQSRKLLTQASGYTLHYGQIVDPANSVIDDVMISLFRMPKSYTGEDMVEISCHGSQYIQQEILKLIISSGARMAEAGEFTVRAFLAGKLDLSQAEAVADIIASSDKATHAMASNQMRGGYSSEFIILRDKLIELISLLELELDFSEEDVEFADRSQLTSLLEQVSGRVETLLSSFSLGNALKEGIAVAIVGAPNAGKSTLLNALLKDDRAMVSEIAGTTRDVIEEVITISGVKFRFLDTAGIRSTNDQLEQMGIERTYSTIGKAQIIILMIDALQCIESGKSNEMIEQQLADLPLKEEQKVQIIINKIDKLTELQLCNLMDIAKDITSQSAYNKQFMPLISISARKGINIDQLVSGLSVAVDTTPLYNGSTIVSNSRHYEALHNAKSALDRSLQGLEHGIASDLLSQDLREVLHHLGIITGEITTDDILGSIFSKFCIGK